MEEVDFSRVALNYLGNQVYIEFGASEGNPLAPLFLAADTASLQGHHAVLSNYLDGFGLVPGCTGPLELYSGGYACDASVRVRRLDVWGPDMGLLTLRGPGYDGVAPNMGAPVYGTNAGQLHWEKDQGHVPSTAKAIGGAYGAHVIVGEEYTLEGLSWEYGDIVVEVSDPVVPDVFGTPREEEAIQLTLKLKDGRTISCRPHAGESRKFHGADGISKGVREAGALGDCGQQFRDLLAPPLVPTIPPSGECGCGGAEYDAECLLIGGMGCSACGIPFCRYCGSGSWQDCKYTSPSQAETTTKTTTANNAATTTTKAGNTGATSSATTTKATTTAATTTPTTTTSGKKRPVP